MLVLRISGVLALTLACFLFILSGVRLCRDDPKLAQIRNMPAAIERLKEANQGRAESSHAIPPLLAQAEALAAYLNRAAKPAPALSVRNVPSPRPATPLERVKVYATSYCANQPDKSMALISDPGSGREGQRWVKTGSRFGSFVVHEVRAGAVVYRDGNQLREAVVEHGVALPSVVRDVRPGSNAITTAVADADVPRVAGWGWALRTQRSRSINPFRSAARGRDALDASSTRDGVRGLPAPTEPNSITISDN